MGVKLPICGLLLLILGLAGVTANGDGGGFILIFTGLIILGFWIWIVSP